MRFAVLIKGILRGMGREAPCEVLATKSVVPETSRPIYSHCAVIEAPADLPDGDYEVEFSGEVAITRLQEGCWQVGSVMPRTYADAATFFANEARRVAAKVRKRGEGQLAMSGSDKTRTNS
jgi:hypothetical protein